MIFGLFRKSPWKDQAAGLYAGIVSRARLAAFYKDGGVPDTVDGRFDLVALHAFLVMRRLKRAGTDDAQELSQALFDHMFADMDQNLREIGVSDLSVGRKVKQMAKAFYGRVAAYDAALEDTSPSRLADALERNLLRKTAPDPDRLDRLAAYVRETASALDAHPLDRLLAGESGFEALAAPTKETFAP